MAWNTERENLLVSLLQQIPQHHLAMLHHFRAIYNASVEG